MTTLYKALVHLYPSRFRREFGEEMVCDFDDHTGDAWTAKGWLGVLEFWLVAGADLIWTVPVQWVRSGVPTLVAISATWSTLCCVLIAQQGVPRGAVSRMIPPGNPEQAMVIMLLAVAVVVVVIAVTIVVTGWFWMQVLRRKRRA